MSPEARERSFDELTRGLASGTLSRRRALRLMGAALVGGTLASLGIGEAAADPPGCKRKGKNCKRDTQCCSGVCSNGTCATCPADRVLINDTCVKICAGSEDCAGGRCLCAVSHTNIAVSYCAAFGGGSSCANDSD